MDKETAYLLKNAQDNYALLQGRIAKAEAKILQLNDVQVDIQAEIAQLKIDIGEA